MAQLIGTAPNQVPTNGDLGSAAYMDTSAFYSTGQNPVFRNRIINGDMRIDQRNNGGSVTWSALQSNVYNLDRYQYYTDVVNLLSVQRSTTAPPGFSHSVLFTSLTAAGTQTQKQVWWGQTIEAFNMTDLAWGTADAKPATVSFWVRCSIAGTFGGAIQSTTADLSYPFTFTIPVVNTWQYVTFTVPGPTGGTWTKDSNASGGSLRFEFNGVGYNSGTGTPNTWTSGNNTGPIGTTRFVATNGATMNITGVQLEKGTQATPFEYRPYGMELILCQRYYQKLVGGDTYGAPSADAYCVAGYFFGQPFTLPVTMRAKPTGTLTGSFSLANCSSLSVVSTDSNSVYIAAVTTATGMAYFHSNSTAGVTLAAEL
jgi:hypothetical protein